MAVVSSQDRRQIVNNRDEAFAACLALLQQANRRICFFAPSLDHFLLGHEQALTRIRAFILAQRSAQIRLLVHSSRDAIQNSHGLLQLSQRLTSRMHVHCCAPEDQHQQQLCLLTDDQGSLFLPDATRYRGHVTMDDRVWNAQLTKQFEVLWRRSEPDQQARRLTL